MKILAIDTSSNICSVAILENDKLIDEINLGNGKTHSENLLPIIDEILEKNQINLSDFDLISCCVGPGSFTGIRIGVSTVKAMAEVNKLPIASVTSLETLARIDESTKNKIVLIDAKNNQVYCGVFNKDYNNIEDFMADDINLVLEKIKKYKNSVFIGDGAILHKGLIEKNMFEPEFTEENEQLAANVGKIGYIKFMKKDLKNSDNLIPIYLRKSQAERMKERK